MKKRKLRMGMVGGGQGAFIGAVHRIAANLDGQIDLVCGAFSSDPKKSKASGEELFLSAERCYNSFEEMIESERNLPSDVKMDFVSIVTPNHVHFAPAYASLKAGFPVVIDKPLSLNYAEAVQLRGVIKETKLPFAVTYTYSGYPMIKQARAMVSKGEIGKVRKIMVEYPQGWLTNKLEDTDQKQASWRTDPKRSGISGCFGDIGTHATQMAEYVSGLEVEEILSEINTFVPGRLLEDDANVLVRYEGGANGVISASQIATNEENDIKIRIYGDKGGLEWAHADPNSLLVKLDGKPNQVYRAGGNNAYLHEEAKAHLRTPAGHPEGYLEAFANIYRNFSTDVLRHLIGDSDKNAVLDYPTIEDGVKGMAMIDAVVESTNNGNVWTKLKK